MKILHIKGADVMMGLHQNEYFTVPLVAGREYVTDEAGNTATVANRTGAFKPTPEELERLNAGASIHLTILGTSWPPMKLLVQQPPSDPENPDDIEFEDLTKPHLQNEKMQNELLPGQFVPQMRGDFVQVVDACQPCVLEQGDQILTADHIAVRGLEHFMAIIADCMKVEQAFVDIEVMRGGKPMTVGLQLSVEVQPS